MPSSTGAVGAPESTKIDLNIDKAYLSQKSPFFFKVAESKAELKAAFRVVYESYRQKGLTEKTESRLRLNEFHLLPESSVLIAIHKGRVVATVSLVETSEAGLPINVYGDMEYGMDSDRRIAEIHCLAIHPVYQKQARRVLLQLLQFLTRYCLNCLSLDEIVFSCSPKAAKFYERVFLADCVQGVSEFSYAPVRGARAVLMNIDIREWVPRMRNAYRGKQSDLGDYIFDAPCNRHHFPSREDRLWSRGLGAEELAYFGLKKSQLINRASPFWQKVFRKTYPQQEYKFILADSSITLQKRPKRYEAKTDGYILFEGKKHEFELINLSVNGFCAQFKEPLNFGIHHMFRGKIRGTGGWRVVVRPTWRNNRGMVGFCLERVSETWPTLVAKVAQCHETSFNGAVDISFMPIENKSLNAQTRIISRAKRYLINATGHAKVENQSVRFHIKDISRRGFCAKIESPFLFGNNYILDVTIDLGGGWRMKAKPTWRMEDGSVGFELVEIDSRWANLVSRISNNMEAGTMLITQVTNVA